MEIITDNFDNLSINQLYLKLSSKYAQLQKAQEKQSLEKVSKKDYIEASTQSTKNYDERDFARVLEKFKQTDAKIRSHEQVHASIGHTTTPISYNYQQGPDGKMYAVGGSVRFDTSIPNDSQSAIFKLDQLQKAATAVGEPSSADTTIATKSNLNKILLQLKEENNANQ